MYFPDDFDRARWKRHHVRSGSVVGARAASPWWAGWAGWAGLDWVSNLKVKIKLVRHQTLISRLFVVFQVLSQTSLGLLLCIGMSSGLCYATKPNGFLPTRGGDGGSIRSSNSSFISSSWRKAMSIYSSALVILYLLFWTYVKKWWTESRYRYLFFFSLSLGDGSRMTSVTSIIDYHDKRKVSARTKSVCWYSSRRCERIPSWPMMMLVGVPLSGSETRFQ